MKRFVVLIVAAVALSFTALFDGAVPSAIGPPATTPIDVPTPTVEGPITSGNGKIVVQSSNFREMPAFVKFAEEVNADSVIFQRYYSFGHEGSGVFSAKDVASPAHPEHHELQAILEGSIMRSPRVNQTFIAQLAASPSS